MGLHKIALWNLILGEFVSDDRTWASWPIPYFLFKVTCSRLSDSRDDSYLSERHAKIWKLDLRRGGGGGKNQFSSRFIVNLCFLSQFRGPSYLIRAWNRLWLNNRNCNFNLKRTHLLRSWTCEAGLAQCFVAVFLLLLLFCFVFVFVFSFCYMPVLWGLK